jgi:hypothetical protein
VEGALLRAPVSRENESAGERLEMIDLRAKQSEKQGTMQSVCQESTQVLVDLFALGFPATVGKWDPGCVLIVRDPSIGISDNQIHIQESFISLFINADNTGQKRGLTVHGRTD